MIFSTAIFLFFFVVVATVHWYLIPTLPERFRLRATHWFLLLASYFFYMNWDWRFGFLIAFSTLVDFACGLTMGRLDELEGYGEPGSGKSGTTPDTSVAEPRRDAGVVRLRRVALVLSLLTNLGVLGYFKYADFFIGSFVDFVNILAPNTYSVGERDSLLLKIILPLGISFFTFQSMSYTIDVYRRAIPVEKSLLRFALFVSFFPQLVAGPIVTARVFLYQLDSLPEFNLDRMRVAGRWFLLGFFKKTVLADNMAPIVDEIYAHSELYGPVTHWVGAYAFLVQIYCDFSGYSDMAWGAALFLGYKLPENFRLPFLSLSITEFWQRWHISLIAWIRDYLYIPLGGNRVGFLRHKLNIFLTMFLAGFWHGASWAFVLWGSIHGMIMVLEAIWRQFIGDKTSPGDDSPLPAPRWISRGKLLFTFAATLAATGLFNVTFRSQTVGQALLIMGRMLGLDVGEIPDGGYIVKEEHLRVGSWGILAVAVGHVLGYYIFEKKTMRPQVPAWLELALYPPLILLFAQLGAPDVQAFIYFVF